MGGPSRESKGVAPHDEAFKKLLQTFFAEFLELFFPEVNELLDYRHTRLLMQELLVDVVGEEARILDLLVETRYRATDAYILVHLEPQSYRQDDFHERMFIYFSRLFERHRRQHKLVIPIAIFTSDQARDEPDTYAMEIPGHEIVKFRFLKVELRGQDWRKFVDSDNPVAAALLAKMGYNERDKKQVRLAYLRMLLRLGRKLDDARLALVMSVADVYFNPDPKQDEAMLRDLGKQDPEGAKAFMEMKDLVPMWKRWGYEEGIEKGREEGRLQLIRKLLEKGFDPDEVAATLELPLDEVRKAERPV